MNTTLKPRNEIEATDNNEVTNEFDIDTLINNIKKSFLSEATKEDPTKGIIATTFCYNGDYLLSLTYIDYHHPSPYDIGTECQAPDTNSPYTVGISEHVGVPTSLDLKSCYLVVDPLSDTGFHRLPNSPLIGYSVLYNGECWNYNALKFDRLSFDGRKSPNIKPSAVPSLVSSLTPSVDAGGVCSYFPSLESSSIGLLFGQQPLRKRLF